jgi:hypothetical protein
MAPLSPCVYCRSRILKLLKEARYNFKDPRRTPAPRAVAPHGYSSQMTTSPPAASFVNCLAAIREASLSSLPMVVRPNTNQFNPDRPKFKGKTRLDGRAAENKAAVRATAVHFGTWSVNEADKTLTVHQEANIFPNDDGLDVKRTIALVGDELKMTNPNPSSGGTATVVWRRAKLAN